MTILFSLLTAIVGLITVASAVEGYFTEPLSFLSRLILAVGGLALIAPNIQAAGIGLLLVVTVIGPAIYKKLYSK